VPQGRAPETFVPKIPVASPSLRPIPAGEKGPPRSFGNGGPRIG